MAGVPPTLPAVPLGEWKHSLFGCTDNMGVCLFTCFCPCCQYGKNAEMFEGASCFGNGCIYVVCFGLQCLCHGPRRTRMRLKYGLQEVCINDCVTTCCCTFCAICQEANELQSRGGAGAGAPLQQNMA